MSRLRLKDKGVLVLVFQLSTGKALRSTQPSLHGAPSIMALCKSMVGIWKAKERMDYELYHDESLEGGYWHGILFVPVWKKQEYIELLADARRNFKYGNKLGIKNVKQRGRV